MPERCRWPSGRPRLEKARACFQKFLADHREHPLVVSANRHLADVLVEQGKLDKELARQSGKPPDERDRLLEQARGLFADAQKALAVVDAQLNKTQKSFGKVDPSDTAAIQRRNQVRSEIILTRLALAKTFYEIAATYEPDSNRRKVALEEAAAKFGEYYWKYEQWLGGCVFRLEEARCYKELGDYANAMTILDELATLRSGDEQGFRQIRTAATKLALQTLLAPKMKKYKDAWAWYEKWESGNEQSGEPDAEAAAVTYLGGEAALELARAIDKNDAAQAELRQEYLKRAKDLLSLAASSPGEYRKKARLLLHRSVADRRPGTRRNAQGLRRRLRAGEARLGAAARGKPDARGDRPLPGRGAGVFSFRLGAPARRCEDRRSERHSLLPGLLGMGRRRLLRRGGAGRVSRPPLSRRAARPTRRGDRHEGLRPAVRPKHRGRRPQVRGRAG